MVKRGKAVACLLAAASVLGALAVFFATRDYTPDAPRPSFVGSIAFASTDDVGAFDVTVTPVEDPKSGAWSVLRLHVGTTNVHGAVAVGLTGDARLARDRRLSEGGSVSTDQSDAGLLWARDLDAVFSPEGRGWDWRNSGEPAPDGPPPMDVIVGSMDQGRCGNDQCGFELNLPLGRPVISGEGATWTASSPTFGVPPNEDLLAGRATSLGAEPGGSLADQRLEGTWYVPTDLEVSLDLGRHVRDSIQTTGSAPVPTAPGLWAGEAAAEPPGDDRPPQYWPGAGEVLKVDATFQRPERQQELVDRDQRQQFYAGIAVSLSASLFMWAAELVVGPRLSRT